MLISSDHSSASAVHQLYRQIPKQIDYPVKIQNFNKMIKALFLATLVAVAVAAPADDKKDETLDTAAQGIIGYSPGLYGGIVPGGVHSTVYSSRTYRTHGGIANLGYGGYGLGYGIPYGGAIGYGLGGIGGGIY